VSTVELSGDRQAGLSSAANLSRLRRGKLNLTRFFNKPEYFCRPQQILYRSWQGMPFSKQGHKELRVSWGETIYCNTSEDIGRSIAHYGIYDLVTSETIHRLLDAKDVAMDIGANIGHMTGIMARRCGPEGRIISFEASGIIYSKLLKNVNRWNRERNLGQIEAHNLAVSNKSGAVTLYHRDCFGSNEGTASLESPPGRGTEEVVQAVTIDEFVASNTRIGLAKIDVEGHELSVLQGAAGLLSEGRVRDIVFEEHGCYPTPVHQLLEDSGYRLFRLTRSFSQLVLRPPNQGTGPGEDPAGVLPNFLASLDPDRVQALLKPPGWRTLRA
jgi:FkbM family methyltransferase